MLKKLILGKFSLAKTFWLFGFLGGVIITLIAYGPLGIILFLNRDPSLLFWLWFLFFGFLDFLLDLMVFSGITFILRNNKITFWGVIAWALYFISVLGNLYFMCIWFLAFFF